MGTASARRRAGAGLYPTPTRAGRSGSRRTLSRAGVGVHPIRVSRGSRYREPMFSAAKDMMTSSAAKAYVNKAIERYGRVARDERTDVIPVGLDRFVARVVVLDLDDDFARRSDPTAP